MELQLEERDSSQERSFKRREKRRLAMIKRRENESKEEKLKRKNENRESMRRRRGNKNKDQMQNHRLDGLRRKDPSVSEVESELEVERDIVNRGRRGGRVYKIGLTNAIPRQFYIGTCTTICEFCSARYFETEKPRRNLTPCCSSGKINLELRREPPELLTALFTNIHPKSDEFLKNTRTYNNPLALVSATANIEMPLTPGVYCFRIHGQIYHATSFYIRIMKSQDFHRFTFSIPSKLS